MAILYSYQNLENLEIYNVQAVSEASARTKFIKYLADTSFNGDLEIAADYFESFYYYVDPSSAVIVG